ncbi:hypothetical protein HHI36_017381 [Cryptolaemus montrouzieri]|uniref:Uncharacterized protein n=1 Tax=Cryptolaemus montrouzieri TaxID=559131 RepID=A0ABD2NNK1_9CUCU
MVFILSQELSGRSQIQKKAGYGISIAFSEKTTRNENYENSFFILWFKKLTLVVAVEIHERLLGVQCDPLKRNHPE